MVSAMKRSFRQGVPPSPPLVLATRNPGKMKELASPLLACGFTVRLLPPGAPDVEENGACFEENALLKARAAARYTGCPALADDSGLEVAALEGAPGVRSARYAEDVPPREGESRDARNIRKLLRALEACPEPRAARFHCCMALVFPRGERADLVTHGVWDGFIAISPAGGNGFGYDPVFRDPLSGLTAAQLGEEEKRARSHRGRALRLLLEALARREADIA
jgi:XTP/dITP diphosphohydrolase